MIREFALQASVTLHNAWLLEDNREELAKNRRLRDELLSQNLSLEARVIDRTSELHTSLEQLKGASAERQRLLSHLVRAQEDERRRIAGDIHDDPLQLLVVVTMRLDFLRRVLADPKQATQVSALREMVRDAIAKLRTLMFELRPPILEEQGLAAALRAHAEQWSADQQIVIHDRFAHEPPAEPRLILYRIAQEALANARKHSQADRVVVTLEDREGSFVVHVEDDGRGFSPGLVAGRSNGHIGLTSMRERAELAGGGCSIHSLVGGGTTVEFWLPPVLEARSSDRSADALAD
jgi:signal transduction histidine kinase